MRGGMHKDVRAYTLIGKNEADGVVDASVSDLVRGEEQGSNREAGCVGAGALISSSRGRIYPIEIPDCDKACC